MCMVPLRGMLKKGRGSGMTYRFVDRVDNGYRVCARKSE